MAGFATSLWQANPTLTNIELLHVLQESGSIESKPDNLLGYGIPNFKKAQEIARKKASLKGKSKEKENAAGGKKDE
jgi:hypothetical protein